MIDLNTRLTHKKNAKKRSPMKNTTYTILQISEKLGEAKQLTRKRIFKLGIESINRDERQHNNEPLLYNHNAYLQLEEDFEDTMINTQEHTENTRENAQKYTEKREKYTENTRENNKGTEKIDSYKMLVSQLRDDLKHERERTSNLEILLSQQQQLAFNDREKIQVLELELKETTESVRDIKELEQEGKKLNWFNRWKKKKD